MKKHDVGAAIKALYKSKADIRIQNVPGLGFYGCFTSYPIFYHGINADDFNKPAKEIIVDASKANRFNRDAWYYSKSLKEVCNFLLNEKAKKSPEILMYAQKRDDIPVEEILNRAHQLGFRFIIESTWDLGYDVYLAHEEWSDKKEEANLYTLEEIDMWIQKHIWMHVHHDLMPDESLLVD